MLAYKATAGRPKVVSKWDVGYFAIPSPVTLDSGSPATDEGEVESWVRVTDDLQNKPLEVRVLYGCVEENPGEPFLK